MALFPWVLASSWLLELDIDLVFVLKKVVTKSCRGAYWFRTFGVVHLSFLLAHRLHLLHYFLFNVVMRLYFNAVSSVTVNFYKDSHLLLLVHSFRFWQ